MIKKAFTHNIPLVVVEEHHEAFYVWNYAVQKGWLAPNGNTLLHVDNHADMSVPRLRRRLTSIGGLSDLAEFTYHELDIGNFIWPAVYLGVFSRVLWLRYRQETGAGGWRTIFICSKDDDKREFVTASTLGPYENSQDIRSVEYAPITTGEHLSTEFPVILDIDLDYFCCNEHPNLPERKREIEVTRVVFEEFHRNNYHFLRISPGGKISAVARRGRYFLIYQDYPPSPRKSVTRSSIRERIDDFVNYLRSYSVIPPLIVICHSVYSGYTPSEHIAFIKKTLIKGLETLYSLNLLSIQGLMPRAADYEYRLSS
jgi:hypothetical protein